MFQRILIAIDPSSARLQALRTVADLARLSDATVHVVHVSATAQAYEASVPLEDDGAARAVLAEAVKALHDAGVQADGELLTGTVADIPATIIRAGEQVLADLLVLSPHHRGSFATWLSPHVSSRVSRTARIPVLLLPDPAGS